MESKKASRYRRVLCYDSSEHGLCMPHSGNLFCTRLSFLNVTLVSFGYLARY